MTGNFKKARKRLNKAIHRLFKIDIQLCGIARRVGPPQKFAQQSFVGKRRNDGAV